MGLWAGPIHVGIWQGKASGPQERCAWEESHTTVPRCLVSEDNLTTMKAIPQWMYLEPPSVRLCDRRGSMFSYSKYLESVLQKNHHTTLFKKEFSHFPFRIHGDSYWQPHSNSKYQMTQRATLLGIIQIYGGCECQNSELFLLSFTFLFCRLQELSHPTCSGSKSGWESWLTSPPT